MTRRTLAMIAVLSLASPCFAGKDRDFQTVVNAIETQYGVHHMHIPLLGFASFCVRMTGGPGFKLAVFEHVRSANAISPQSLADSMDAAIGNPWHPLVRVRDHGQLTLIYTNPDDKKLSVLIVCLDGEDATVVQTKVKASQIRKWMRDPDDAAEFRTDSSSPATPHAADPALLAVFPGSASD